MSKSECLLGEYLAEARQRLLPILLRAAGEKGWHETALLQALCEANLDPSLYHRAFPEGVEDVLHYWFASGDAEVARKAAALDIQGMRIRERIAALVTQRITLHEGQQEALRHAMLYCALPQHAPLGIRVGYATVETLWRLAGDRSTDFSFYTRRLTLAAVYKTTLLYWLNDTSDGHAESWAFLARRIENVMQFEKFKGECRKQLANLPFLRPAASHAARA